MPHNIFNQILDVYNNIYLHMNHVIDLNIFLENHYINIEDSSGRIHREFPIWLKKYVNEGINGVTNQDIIALSRCPSSMVISWNMYFINGY